jgi:predicted metal-dependent phosphoesterase TrpH
MHTNFGDGWISPARLIEAARLRGLTLIAVTDHDQVEGARRVEELLCHESGPVQMITGVEVSTRRGHLIGLFVKHAPKPMRPVEESIDAIKQQGGLVIVPHPLGRLVPSLSRRRIESLLAAGYVIDGIETYNPSPANAAQRAAVRAANEEWGLAEIGASDAHFWQHFGAGYTHFPGESAQDYLRQTRSGGT